MNLLIVTPFYKQDRTIGSVRWTKLTERLARNHHVIVVTQPVNDMDEAITITEEDGITVVRANQKTWYEKIAVKYFSGKTGDDWQTKASVSPKTTEVPYPKRLFRYLKNRLCYYAMQTKAVSYANWICKHAIPKGMKIDVVINSACPFIEMLFGYQLKKKLKCKWICDFRDLPFLKDVTDDTHIARRIMAQKMALADKITVVTRGSAEIFRDFFPDYAERLEVVTNGFSETDRREHSTIDDDKLHIVYTGSFASSYNRIINSLFSAIHLLKTDFPDLPFVLDCAGGNQKTIINCAGEHGMKSIVKDHGFLPREEAMQLQNSADILLLLSGNSIALPAKMFEYMLCEKPILCFLYGTNSKGEATEVIREIKLGLAVEEADGEQVVKEVADYLKMQLERKRSGMPLLFNPVTEKVQRYNHDTIAEQIEGILKDITSMTKG